MSEHMDFGMFLFRTTMGNKGLGEILANRRLVYDIMREMYGYDGMDGYYEIRTVDRFPIVIAQIYDGNAGCMIKIVTGDRILRNDIVIPLLQKQLAAYRRIYGKKRRVTIE